MSVVNLAARDGEWEEKTLESAMERAGGRDVPLLRHMLAPLQSF
jgi:hypothetical protein